MHRLKVGIAALALGAVVTTVAAANVMDEIGKIQVGGGLVSLMIIDVSGKGKKSGAMYVSDRTGIKTNMVAMDRAQLVTLRGLVDSTIAELDKQAPEQAPK